MVAPSVRSIRMGRALYRELVLLIERNIKDPRAKGIRVTDVVLDEKLHNARVFYTTNNGEDLDGKVFLTKFSNFLRTQLSAQLSLRRVPTLHFVYDDSQKRSQLLDTLLS